MDKKFVLIGIFLLAITVTSGSGVIYLIAGSESEVVLSVKPDFVEVDLGESFTVTVNVANVKDLNKWEMKISWNATVLELDPPNNNAVEEGSFLKSAGPTEFEVSTYNTGSGVLSRISCSLLQAKGASGSGALLKLHFKAISGGETSITISDSKLYDFMFRSLSHTTSSGEVSVSSVLRDISIVSFECLTDVALGESVKLNVTVVNRGEINETNVNVTIYVNGKLNQTKIISKLVVGSNETCSFLWTPSADGVFNVTAYAVPVLGETKTSDNYCTVQVEVISLVHDVMVSLESPTRLVLGNSVTLNVTVINVGTFNEMNVNVSIIINDVTRKSKVIALLVSGSSQELAYLWNPAHEGMYNITAYVQPVSEEVQIVNNKEYKFVNVVKPSTNQRILIVSDDNGDWHEFGTSLSEFEHALTLAGYEYDVWKESENGYPPQNFLLNYETVIWTVGDYLGYSIDNTDKNLIAQYIKNGGNILVEGQFVPEEGVACDVLHVKFITWNFREGQPLAENMTLKEHTITNGLPSNLELDYNGTYNGLCILVPDKFAYEVAHLNLNPDIWSLNKSTAVNVYDGTQNGEGSLIYFSFAFRWMPKEWRQVLIKNCVNWFERQGVSTVTSKIVHAKQNTVYFVYAAPESGFGSYIPQGVIIHEICVNNQNQLLASGNATSVLANVRNSFICLLGSPEYNNITNYFEREVNATPIAYYFNSSYVTVMSRENTTLFSLLSEDITSGRRDGFVLYTFKDESANNTYLVLYGFGVKGCWAADVFFSDVVVNNLPAYSKTYYVFLWEDNDGNLVPEVDEVSEVSSG